MFLFDLSKIKESIEFYNKAIHIDSNYALAFSKKGWSLIFLDKYNEAIECINKAIELDPALIEDMQLNVIIKQ